MNANELADELEVCRECELPEYVHKTATMLRKQQADLEHMWMANTVLQVEVEALKAKTLTDEEIQNVYSEKHEIPANILAFARAILRKAQEK